MTLKDDKDSNSVRFNPLVKLDKSVIEKVPENLRIITRRIFELSLIFFPKI